MRSRRLLAIVQRLVLLQKSQLSGSVRMSVSVCSFKRRRRLLAITGKKMKKPRCTSLNLQCWLISSTPQRRRN